MRSRQRRRCRSHPHRLPGDGNRNVLPLVHHPEAAQDSQGHPGSVCEHDLKDGQEAITQLEHLGVNHLELILHYPGADQVEGVNIAVTPDEERYVPQGIKTVINIQHRSCTSGMMIEIALRLGFEELLETREFQAYFLSMATNDYSFGHMLERSTRMESRFDILIEILDEGLIGINEKGGDIRLQREGQGDHPVSQSLITGRRGEEVFPYIPFRKCLETRTALPASVISIGGINVNMSVTPVMRQNECIGVFATLQRFNDVEKRQKRAARPAVPQGPQGEIHL